MTFIDTHTHIYLPEFDNDRDQVVAGALSTGVEAMLMPNINSSSFPVMMEVAQRYPGICIPMIGLHPTSVKSDYRKELAYMLSVAETYPFVAVGETGIDLYHDITTLEIQKESFRVNIELALKLKLPLVIHARNSFSVIFSILDEYRGSGLKGVFHAFTGTEDQLLKVQDLGFMIGIGGIITFKNPALAAVIAGADITSIVLETDSPYLAPAPHRGKRNESSYLPEINARIAGLLSMSPEDTSAITSAGAKQLFNL